MGFKTNRRVICPFILFVCLFFGGRVRFARGADCVLEDRVARGRDGWLFWNYAQALCVRKGVGGGI